MKKHFTKNEITILAENLNNPGLAVYTGAKFHYALSKNRRLISYEMEDISKGLTVSKEMGKFMDTLDCSVAPSPEIKPEIKPEVKPEVKPEGKKEKPRTWHKCGVEELCEIIEKNKSKEGVDEKLSQETIDKLKSNRDLLDSIVEIELHKIEQDILPENINGNHFRMLEPFIMDDDPRAPKPEGKATDKTEDKNKE